MGEASLRSLVWRLRRTLSPRDGGPDDGELLARYGADRDEVA